jgi:hypothetical protein
MEYTEQYSYVTFVGSAATPVNSFVTVLNFSNDRVPYALVEVIAGSLNCSKKEESCFILRTQEIAQNYLGNDNFGTTLGVIAYDGDHDPSKHSYVLSGFGSKVMFSNPRSLNIFLTTQAGVVAPISTVAEAATNIRIVTLLLKVSYPKVGEITPMYRSQIPLPSGL